MLRSRTFQLAFLIAALAACAPAQVSPTAAPVGSTIPALTNTPVPATPTRLPAMPTATPEPTSTPEPTATPEPATQTYRNDAIGFTVNYPQGWVVEEAGDLDIMWSEKPGGPGRDGVPANVVKIDIVTEPNTTLTLDELVERQKQIIADSNSKILLEESITLDSGLEAVRMGVSGFGESLSLLTVIDGHPVMLVGYGNLARFDEIAATLRPVQP